MLWSAERHLRLVVHRRAVHVITAAVGAAGVDRGMGMIQDMEKGFNSIGQRLGEGDNARYMLQSLM